MAQRSQDVRHMKKAAFKTMLLAVFLPLLLFAADKPKVMVFDFNAPFMNDLQKRIFREYVSSKLDRNRFNVAGVMEFEAAIKKLAFRKNILMKNPSRYQIANAAKYAKVEFAVFGNLQCDSITSILDLNENHIVTITVGVIDINTGKARECIFKVKGQRHLYTFHEDVADRAASIIKDYIQTSAKTK